jgi:hypothetical protein
MQKIGTPEDVFPAAPSHGSILNNMATQSSKKNDSVGKVYLYMSPNERRCLICLQVFSRRGSMQHSYERCEPVTCSEHVPAFSGGLVSPNLLSGMKESGRQI